jgi:hypothetical protein
MMIVKTKVMLLALMAALCCPMVSGNIKKDNPELARRILADKLMDKVDSMALRIISTGFNAGDGYPEVWIRDFNTFIELSMEVAKSDAIRTNLNTFFLFQGDDGNIVDGFKDIKGVEKEYIDQFQFSPLAPQYAAHKNTVETDQETSLVQAIYKYVVKSGDTKYLKTKINGLTVYQRLEKALDFLYEKKYSSKYGLILGATTADWGDVQPEYGVDIDEHSHLCADIYDNAMLLIALNNFVELSKGQKNELKKWTARRDSLRQNIRTYLWDEQRHKFIPHLYLNGSPFPAKFDENGIYYHGGTAVAIDAELLSRDEIVEANARMLADMKKAHAQTIGLTLYPTYPAGYFKNECMYPYGYQNGGDWTWFGGRMIQTLVAHGLVEEAYNEIQPMLQRVVENKGFFEWYTPAGEPMGSGTFRGSAGVLFKAIAMLRQWARNNE